MKAVKVFYNGLPLRDVYPHATPVKVRKYRVRRFFRHLAIWAVVLATPFFVGAAMFSTSTVSYATQTVEVPVMPDFPVLERIAKAESYNSQICTAEIAAKKGCHTYEIGAPLIHVNNDGSYDIGKYMINSRHLAAAIKLGYNVYEEKDNRKFAEYLFTTQGSEPWSASKAGWNK